MVLSRTAHKMKSSKCTWPCWSL